MTIVIDAGSILYFVGIAALCIGGGMLAIHALVAFFELVEEIIDALQRVVNAIGNAIWFVCRHARKLLTRSRTAR